MSSQRLAYDDADTTRQMHDDCSAVAVEMHLPVRRTHGVAARAVAASPSIRFEHYPREVRKPEIEVSEAAARLAAALHLHLD
jgi:hypothetical protein